MTIIVNGKKISNEIILNIKKKVTALNNKFNKKIKIYTIMIGENNASNIYVNNKLKISGQIGIKNKLLKLKKNISTNNIINLLKKLNDNINVHGILIQQPLPQHISKDLIFQKLNHLKDIDGFGVYNSGLLNHNLTNILPCTPNGILYILKKYIDKLSGKKVVIIGRSAIVGRPMISILLNENCTVSILHSKSKNKKLECRKANILIACVGKHNFIKANWIKKGCFIIDVGINKIKNKIFGDVDFESVVGKASYITPVPGGIGPLTVASLMINAIKLICIQNKIIIKKL